MELRKRFELKTEMLGPDVKKGKVQEISFLNRIIIWSKGGIILGADPAHAKLLVEQLASREPRMYAAQASRTK